MKDYGWKIKVADLLNNPGSSDIIKFEKKYLKDPDSKVELPGISWEIFLQSLSSDEILWKLKNLKFNVRYTCDKCLEEYETAYEINPNEEIRFVNEEVHPIEEKIYDIVFPIDMKNQVIDLTPLIEIIVKNQEPIVKNCWKHKTKEEAEDEIFQEEINQTTIEFWELLKNKKNVKK